MSLKAFHVVFVAISTLLSAGFGLWAVRDYQRSGNAATLGMGIAGFVLAVGLIVYGKWFLRKLKHVGYL